MKFGIRYLNTMLLGVTNIIKISTGRAICCLWAWVKLRLCMYRHHSQHSCWPALLHFGSLLGWGTYHCGSNGSYQYSLGCHNCTL
jgi:hypothetical protein